MTINYTSYFLSGGLIYNIELNMHINESHGIGKACSSCAHNAGIHLKMHLLELWCCQFIVVRLPIETGQGYSIKFTIIATYHLIHFC